MNNEFFAPLSIKFYSNDYFIDIVKNLYLTNLLLLPL